MIVWQFRHSSVSGRALPKDNGVKWVLTVVGKLQSNECVFPVMTNLHHGYKLLVSKI